MTTETPTRQQERIAHLEAEVAALQDGNAEFARTCIAWMERCERLESQVAEVEKCFLPDPWRDGWLSDLSELLERALTVRDCWEDDGDYPTAILDLIETVADLEGEGGEETVDDRTERAVLRRDGR